MSKKVDLMMLATGCVLCAVGLIDEDYRYAMSQFAILTYAWINYSSK